MLNQHRLSARDFDMLAAGFGSAVTVASLRAAQFSRRLIGLRAVLDAADRAGYSDAPGLAAGWELLKTVQQHDVAASAAVLGYPFVGSWVGHCLRLLAAPPMTPLQGSSDTWDASQRRQLYGPQCLSASRSQCGRGSCACRHSGEWRSTMPGL